MTPEADGPVGRGPLREPGDNPVDAPITCVLTRFQLRSARHLVPSHRDYQRVIRELEQSRVPGFLRAAFLVENPTTWYSLSLWAGDSAIPHFGTASSDHVTAARQAFGRLAYDDEGPVLWSTKWRLGSVSNNLSWPGFDLRGTILDLGEEAGHAR
ncbi:MAG TPA: hypothetical protein VNP92_04630 [Actinophytocola sp.]|nr:hypothetical protein [Actinophytocola sp.]